VKLQEQLELSDDNYGLLFDVRRSIRYHDRRVAFYERFHQITSLLTILMAGSVLFDLARPGETPGWLMTVAVVAALLAAFDMVVGYSRRATLHSQLRERFARLEIEIVIGPKDGDVWSKYVHERLLIEKDEPTPYHVVDALCRNEVLVAQGFTKKKDSDQFVQTKWYQRWTAHLFHWQDFNSA
jgi:hypothetical protein